MEAGGSVDVDAFVAEHAPTWQRTEELARRRRLSGAEADELIGLYQLTATHLSAVQSQSPDPALVGRLSRTVAAARSAVAGSTAPAWSEVLRFFSTVFPATVYRAWRWCCGAAAGFCAVAFATMAYVVLVPSVQTRILPPAEIRELVEKDFESYYSENAAQAFASQVWLNNALLAAMCLIAGVLIFPVLLVLWRNAVSFGLIGGIMISHGKADVFWGLVTPHGLLELTAVFVAAGVGLRLGWSWIAPGRYRTRGQALAQEARAGVIVALGLVVVLALSGVIEAFVTPSPLPTAARVGIGVIAWAAFLGYVLVLGRRAALAGETGDLRVGEREDTAPMA